jgi:hypothetical protein
MIAKRSCDGADRRRASPRGAKALRLRDTPARKTAGAGSQAARTAWA